MIIRYDRLLLVGLMALAMPVTKLCAYKCTFKNNTTRAIIKVKFHRAALWNANSQTFTLAPGEQASWDTGIMLVTGMKVVEMKYFPDAKGAVLGGGLVVPGSDKAKENYAGRAVNQHWEMYEIKYPIDANKSQIQFELKRDPAGLGGSTYPGGTKWTSPRIDIIEGLQKVQVVQ